MCLFSCPRACESRCRYIGLCPEQVFFFNGTGCEGLGGEPLRDFITQVR